MLLEGRRAVVYGGGGAVGGAVAKAFAREGAHVFLAGRSAAPLEAVAEDIAATGGKVDLDLVDATDSEQVEAHLVAVASKAGPTRVMFNGSGWVDAQGAVLTEIDFDRFFRVTEVALKNWFVTGTAMARHMAANGGGSIVGITANAGTQAYSHTGGFGIACAAVQHYLRLLAVENGPMGVRVNWVRSPGSPDAPGVREAWQLRADEWGMSFEDVHTHFAKDTPLRRVTPLAQIADAAVFLASDLSAGMTASMINATGGAQSD